ncbi:MAG: hypothetical protein LWW86_10835 [Micrococcales bacterium]|nr:hypothetical protein [Micrococcales bacterium]
MSTPPARTFADALSEAVRSRGLPLDRIQRRLSGAGVPVSVATLSYWQSGRSVPRRARSLEAVAELERILEVAPGTLTSLVLPPGAARPRTLESQQDLVPGSDAVLEIIAGLGLGPQVDFVQVSAHDTLHIDAERRESVLATRSLSRCERDGADRWPVVFGQDSLQPGAPVLEAVSGCRLGRVVSLPDAHLTVAEMIAPRPFEHGELMLSEHLVRWAPSGSPSFRWERAFIDRVREFVAEVRFDPAALPARAFAYSTDEIGRTTPGTLPERPVPLDGGFVQTVTLDAPAGVYGIRWEWA